MPKLAMSIGETNLADAQALRKWLIESNGYLEVKILPDGSVAALMNLLFTRAICLGCHWEGWSNRYCFEDRALADLRFSELTSEDEVPAGHTATRIGSRPTGRPLFLFSS